MFLYRDYGDNLGHVCQYFEVFFFYKMLHIMKQMLAASCLVRLDHILGKYVTSHIQAQCNSHPFPFLSALPLVAEP